MKKVILFVAMALACASASAQNLKFAHVNFTELVQLMPEMDEARNQSDAAAAETQETYQAMIEEFQSKYQEYEQKRSTWTPSVLQSKEKSLQDVQQRIAEFEQSAQAELQQLQQNLMAPIYEKAQDTITKIAKEQGVIYVIDVQSALYINDSQSIDLTPMARKALNIPADRTLESLQAELMAKAQAQQAAQAQ
ncbi:MAG: OmpH family outer membrane protein [Bacteroidales bacterium]|nr:OmpH family outer membrane protein [Candidatus Cryptobacteroides caccocaballi]